jgi:cobyrinic acid a,c-diamide synthase
MTLIIAGDRSGVGKTTITLAILAYLKKQEKSVQSFKVGPDYIDLMFHQYITGRAGRNLDPILTSEIYVKQSFQYFSQDVDYAVIEGVMGLFDGVTLTPTVQKDLSLIPDLQLSPDLPHFASTAHIALLLNQPVLLVLDCQKLSGSIGAIAHGFMTFHPQIKIAGIILNQVGSDRHLQLLKTALSPLNLPILGVFTRQTNISIPDRHLGLIPTDEISYLDEVIADLTVLAENYFDWAKLLPLLQVNQHTQPINNASNDHRSHTNINLFTISPEPTNKILLGVAKDQAFNFYYQDNLDLLDKLGAELIFFSPLHDQKLPANLQGLYFGGGFPEIFAEALSANSRMRQSIYNAILQNMPTYAECGGLMYLTEAIIDFANNIWQMVGILPTKAVMGKRLKLGYRQVLTAKDSCLIPAETKLYGHEFHRSDLSINNTDALYQICRVDQDLIDIHSISPEGWHMNNIHASYIHLHWGNQIHLPAKFLEYCQEYSPKPAELSQSF